MQFYVDPLSGYIFFSKLDALRYLDSGDIKKCAMRPLRKDMNEEDYVSSLICDQLWFPLLKFFLRSLCKLWTL